MHAARYSLSLSLSLFLGVTIFFSSEKKCRQSDWIKKTVGLTKKANGEIFSKINTNKEKEYSCAAARGKEKLVCDELPRRHIIFYTFYYSTCYHSVEREKERETHRENNVLYLLDTRAHTCHII